MARKYKIGLFITGTLLIFSLLIMCSYQVYIHKQEEEKSLVIVNNGLSINYAQDRSIKLTNDEKKYTFSVTNNEETQMAYYIFLENIKSNKSNINYALLEKNNKIKVDQSEFRISDPYLANYIFINPGETHNFELTFYKENNLSLEADILVGIEDSKEDFFATTLLKNNEVKKETITKVGEEIATQNEGLIEATDDNSPVYYFRGVTPNNYVDFAGLLWRIVKINRDGTIKLVLDDYIENSFNFYNNENTNEIKDKLNFTTSNIYTSLEEWYNKNLSNYEKNIVTIKYCVDDSISLINGEETTYLASSRILTDYNPIHNCLGTTYTSKIGLLTADEVLFAGGSKNSDNTSFYLYTKDKTISWWTMTPNKSKRNEVAFFEVTPNGKIESESLGSYYRGIKPVINLPKKTIVTGEGTRENPYMIKE